MIFAFAGQKGGVGKTTTAISVAVELLRRGRSVLLADGDPQQSARVWGQVATEAGHPAPSIAVMGANLYQPSQLPKMATAYDFAVIDCPPNQGEIQRAALMCADVAVLPGVPEVDPGLLGANLVLEGFPELSFLPLATRLQFPSGATIFVTEQNAPCIHPARKLAEAFEQPRLAALFPKAAIGRRGLVGLVEREGLVRTGDAIRVIAPPGAVSRRQPLPATALL